MWGKQTSRNLGPFIYTEILQLLLKNPNRKPSKNRRFLYILLTTVDNLLYMFVLRVQAHVNIVE